MAEVSCRVRKARLTAPSEAMIRSAAVALEDALRTALLPWSEPGRCIFVRSLDLGVFLPRISSSSLSLVIEQEFRKLAVSVSLVHASSPNAGRYPVVYFTDDAEPHVLLAESLSRGRDVSAWFWPLAVPAWRPSMSREVAFKRIVRSALETGAGIVAAASVLESLAREESLSAFLSALTGTDGGELMRASGWSVPRIGFSADGEASPFLERSAAAPAPEIIKWIDRWGVDDERSLWVAATTLVGEKPSRLIDPQLISKVGCALRLHRKRSREPNRVVETQTLERPAKRPAHRLRGVSVERAGEIEKPEAESVDGPELSSPVVEPVSEPPSIRRDSNRSRSLQFDRPVDSEIESSPGQDPILAEVPKSTWTEARFTSFGGFYFLLRALMRLDMTGMLERHPELVEADFPQRLLDRIARQLGIPGGDAVRMAGDHQETWPVPGELGFVAPSVWRELWDPGLPQVRRVVGVSGKRALFDPSGRLPAALWRGRAPDAVHGFVGRGLRRGQPLSSVNDIDFLAEAWLTALRRWCRRHAHVGLHSLVHRAGRVTFTRTHVDVVFDLERADARVRRAGLDIDPGWIPWLGRVVTFHYISGARWDA